MNLSFAFKLSLLLSLFVASSVALFATEPTTSANTLSFTAIDGAQFTLSFKAGNGTGRIVVLKAGSDVTGKPVDGIVYNANASFGTAGTGFTAPGEFVVATSTLAQPSITITGLTPGTVYYVAIFEFNTSGTPNPDYSIVTPTDQLVKTVVAPVTQATITGYTAITGNSVKVNWTNGNGHGRIVVAKKGNSLAATPEDLKLYNYNTQFGISSSATYVLEPETFVVYRMQGGTAGQAGSMDITNLEPNTAYTFAIFEYNGYNTPVYLKPGSVNTFTTQTGPTTAPGPITFNTVDGNALAGYWTKGNGSRNLVVVKKGSPVTFRPQNAVTYTANAAFGNAGTETSPGSGEYIVGNSTAGSVSVTGLEPATTYYFAAFGFDMDSNGNTYYLTSSLSEKSQRTAQAPTQNSVVSIIGVTGNSAQLAWANPAGTGTYRLTVIKEGSPVDFVPEDLVKYNSATNVYGSGTQVLPGNYLLYAQSNGGGPGISGLTPGRTYYVSVFEMNGSNAPVYRVPGATVIINIPNEPTAPSTTPSYPNVEGNSIRFDWTNGNGSRRIVVAKKASAISQLPLDGATYTANAQFGQGAELAAGSGAYVVFDGIGNSVTVNGLDKATTYHFAVFEYNTGGTGPDYLSASGKWLASSQTTLAAPTLQTGGVTATNIQPNQATIGFTPGNGGSRLFVMHEASPVDVTPQDLQSYTSSNGIFSLTQHQIGTGNCVVGKGNLSPFVVTGLKPATTYHVAVFECNGNSGPVYLTPGTSYNFTTTSATAVTAPTQAASLPIFEQVDGNKLTFKWTTGNGEGRIVVARKTDAVQFTPDNGVSYAPESSFGAGADLGSQQFVVYKGNGNSVTLTNLEPATSYHFAVYEFNGTGNDIVYLTTPLSAGHSTAVAPLSGSGDLLLTPGSGSITLSWTKGSGDRRLVVAKEGNPITGTPANLSAYTPNAAFKSGSQIAAGEYAVYAGSGNTLTVTGLSAGKTYHFSIFEYNGIDAPVYNTLAIAQGTSSFSSLPVKWLRVAAAEQNGMVVLTWSTAQEENTDQFAIERSSDGTHFQAIGFEKAAGSSQQAQHYSFTDRTNGHQKVYYRIKEIDLDGDFSYSKTIQMTLQKKETLRLLQNPVSGLLQLQLAGFSSGVTLTIHSATGNMLYRSIINTGIFNYPASHLKAGIYYITAQPVNNKPIVIQFVKQ
ncbi:T9SS type A sorting domain-containing protein [Paraflavitalea sp. CAU 1676]|uniref:T9SS type A sorting domain-containing protein n=1 Tax=Paraflavitalea sp. CAU 1676 TaxID=3032598 RepID=UPI0023DB3C22|nr:T9SS type A sorting domain-containing protein [Paraflavitalea sp. CAU 1676]MDF2190652.1 T9SS type A sorting domain-containing protein [Paraflavitalea sp. CAU 1676]